MYYHLLFIKSFICATAFCVWSHRALSICHHLTAIPTGSGPHDGVFAGESEHSQSGLFCAASISVRETLVFSASLVGLVIDHVVGKSAT